MVSDREIADILDKYNTIAVVGLSRDSYKASRQVAEYLQDNGYEIVPINPFADEIMGEKAYDSLLDMPEELNKKVEIVDFFRPPEDVLPHVQNAVKLRKEYGLPEVIWMQLEIINEEAAKLARDEGMKVVMDKCMMVEHRRLVRS
jgi:hypothetical protein